MKKLLFGLSIFAIVLSCSSDETSTPVAPPPEPIVKYTITLSAGEGGTVSTTGGEYESGQTVSVTATPQGEYLFRDWSDGNTDATRTITVSSNSTLTANFEKRKYPLTINFEGEGEVIEEVVNAGRTTDYDSGTTVKLTAQAAAEWVFVGWTGDIESTEESVQMLIGESKEVTATFEKKKYPLTVNIEGEGEVLEEIIEAGRTTDYESSSVVRLIAKPEDGWYFSNWSGSVSSTINPLEVLINEEKTITADFKEINEYGNNTFGNLYFSEINKTTSFFTNNFVFNYLYYDNIDTFKKMDEVYVDEENQIIYPIDRKYLEPKYSFPKGPSSNSFFQHYGNELYFDFNGDGSKEVYLTYTASPFNFSEREDNRAIVMFYEGIEQLSNIITPKDSDVFVPIKIEGNIFRGRESVRKLLVSDVDGDKSYEIINISTGKDVEPFPGDYNSIFSPKTMTTKLLDGEKGFFHGGASGDIDNDGDIDIISDGGQNDERGKVFFVGWLNDGSGNFTYNRDVVYNDTGDLGLCETVELFDLNNDGFLDIVSSCWGYNQVDNLIVIFGNGSGRYDYQTKKTLFTSNNLDPLDIDFYDIDNDNDYDILLLSTITDTPGNFGSFSPYGGYAVSVLINNDGVFTDNTNSYLQNSFVRAEGIKGGFIQWLYLHDLDNDGDIDICLNAWYDKSDDFLSKRDTKVYWEKTENGFVKREIQY